jgi:DNA polymerase-3 subunit gamma/tau
MQQVSLSARPRSLDMLVGQKKVVTGIRGHAASGRLPKAWLFSGPKGTGKTSTARILALAYQCKHQEVFGKPCKECYNRWSSFPIYKINGSEVTGKEEVRQRFQGTEYGILGDGSYRVYILDECHKMSDSAQNLALEYLEDTPETTVFILCSTAPHKIIETLRSRCIAYEFRELGADDTLILVTRLLKKINSTLPCDRLTDALVERGIRSPRLIAQAIEKYAAGLDPDEAAQVDGATEVDVKALCRCVIKGSWEDTAKILINSQPGDMRAIRLNLLAYLRAVLLESTIADRTKAVASVM